MIPDANDPSKIYVTTFGGSVWHGPAAGDPAAPEDAVRVPEAEPATQAPEARLEQLVEASIRGVHAYLAIRPLLAGVRGPKLVG